jgi:molybdopterin-binding protein
LARVTQYSANRMNLEVGKKIFAILKASAFDPEAIGT